MLLYHGMDILGAIILGAVQGLTEFLPVSSTGHLIVARELFGISAENGLAFDALLHLATALAVIVYFWSDWMRLFRSLINGVCGRGIERTDGMLIGAIVVGTIPALILGLLFADTIESVFRSAHFVAYILLFGSAVMLVAEYVARHNQPLTVMRGGIIGCFQALALLPGMSRSGATISGGLLLGLPRHEAARFAFLVSLPIILGAGSLKAFEVMSGDLPALPWIPLILGALTAFGVGLGAIGLLMRFLKTYTLVPFVVYRVLLAGVVLWMVG
jgi:undecaprenyl-diphosphatase